MCSGISDKGAAKEKSGLAGVVDVSVFWGMRIIEGCSSS